MGRGESKGVCCINVIKTEAMQSLMECVVMFGEFSADLRYLCKER